MVTTSFSFLLSFSFWSDCVSLNVFEIGKEKFFTDAAASVFGMMKIYSCYMKYKQTSNKH